ncbi:MATE family efflux transporter [Flavihumibacter sp. CACIAM 22H1]|uniref:MATE family efflux transporter n=1 Tax=Flavihumibacter sp. CACIAM 22H1 TaxID=1812911 RepID=UPI0007A7F36A|nr:MATE family efflux transporter [Flavihumibacter sp. CACIAM 22H1]KYP15647.1 MAG: MATE family efflux transporter [Flavihumibacter sp. CACIAM 22H1]
MRNNTFSVRRLGSIWTFLKAALQGEEQDYTSGSIRRAVFLLAIPMVIEMGMESVFAIVDLYFVGKLADSQHAIQTVGLTESVLSLVYAMAIGISMAATAMVARRVGEKDLKGAAHAAMQSLLVGVAMAVLVSGTGLLLAPDILRWMGAEPETVQIGTPYTRLMMGTSLVITLLFLINGIFRGAGNASMAMKSLMIANIANILLCPLLILGWGPIPAMGLIGAALATTIGRGIGVAYQLYHLFGRRSQISLQLAQWMPDWTTIQSLFKIAAPGTAQFIIGSCSWIFLARLVAETGHSAASAGYQTAIRIMVFFILPAWGMSNAAATLVGQNLGAQKPERAVESVHATARYNAIFMGLVMLVFLFASEWVVGFFTQDPEVNRIGTQALRIMSAGFVFYGIGMVMANAFNGAGDTKTPTRINLVGFWFFQIPLAYLLSKTAGLGPQGVFIAIPVAETSITIAAWLLFLKGRWKHVVI